MCCVEDNKVIALCIVLKKIKKLLYAVCWRHCRNCYI